MLIILMIWSTLIILILVIFYWIKNKYLGLNHFDEIYERIFDRIWYFIMLRSNISDVDPHKCMNESIFNENCNHYY